MIAEVKGSWPIAKSIQNIISLLIAMLHPSKTLKRSARPLLLKRYIFNDFPDFL